MHSLTPEKKSFSIKGRRGAHLVPRRGNVNGRHVYAARARHTHNIATVLFVKLPATVQYAELHVSDADLAEYDGGDALHTVEELA